METNALPTKELLSSLIGTKTTKKLYKGELRPLMIGEGDVKPHPKLATAWELARRMLEEKLRHGPPLISSRVTADFLTAHFLDQEQESFVVILQFADRGVAAFYQIFYSYHVAFFLFVSEVSVSFQLLQV